MLTVMSHKKKMTPTWRPKTGGNVPLTAVLGKTDFVNLVRHQHLIFKTELLPNNRQAYYSQTLALHALRTTAI